MVDTLRNKDNAVKKAEIEQEVLTLCLAHPVPERFV
jgi:hypothetical protein